MKPSHREWQVAQALIKSEPDLAGAEHILLVNDMVGHVADEFSASGAQLHSWQRMSHGAHLGAPWAPDGVFDACFLRISKSKPALDMELHAAASVLRAGAPIWLYGANDEGIRSIGKRARDLFPDIKTHDTRNHCRIWLGHRAEESEPKAPLSAWRAQREMELDGRAVSWVVFPGVFGGDRVDAGTEQLLAALPQPEPALRILDFACGPGAISAALVGREPSIELHCTDADAVALEACVHNVPSASHHLGDAWQAIEQGGFHWIVSNPPIHFGKTEDHRVLHDLIARSKQYLEPGGTLWLVVQRRVPLDTVLGKHFTDVSIASDGNQYRVWKAVRGA